jgi:phosphate transport system substrate-binding protein
LTFEYSLSFQHPTTVTSPSNETIASGAYPFVNDFYVVIRSDEPEDSPARTLRDWLLSDEGAELMRAANYVPIR